MTLDTRQRNLLGGVGAQVRARREGRGLSRRQLSESSGVSERFLAQLESGQGNISLARFADVADALGTSPADLLAAVAAAATPDGAVALLGVRGAGKSTVGRHLAARFAVPFVEVDHRIEEVAGLALPEIFELHGEAYYRRVEREVLTRLLGDHMPVVLATGGSIVNDRDSWALLHGGARTIWLRARAEDHWNRVIQQGDARPMAENPHAFAELEALLIARAPLYAAAHHVFDTSGRSIADVTDDVAAVIEGFAGRRPPALSA
mgnify:CR=1 FL=1